MKVTIVPIVIGAFGTITKGLLKGLEDLEVCGRIETIQITALLRSARILRRVLETCGDLLSLKLQRKTSAKTDVKNSKGVNNNNNNNNDNCLGIEETVEHESDVNTNVIGALGTVTKGLIKGLEDLEIKGRVETIQTTALLRLARILRRVLENRGDLLSVNLLWKTIRLRRYKNSLAELIIINSKCRLYDDRDKTINHIKSRHDWVGKVIHWELFKKLKFDHVNKKYIHNPESILEKERHKFLWDFEIQTDYLILARQPDQVIVNKRKQNVKKESKENLPNRGLDHRVQWKKNGRSQSTMKKKR